MDMEIDKEDQESYRSYLENELGCRPDTVKAYMYYHNRMYGYKNLNQEFVKHFLVNECNNNGVARAFIKNYINYITENEHLYPHIDIAQIRQIKLPRARKQIKRLPVYINEDELYMIERKMNKRRDIVMLYLSFYTGLRLSELIGLEPRDFNWQTWIKDRNQMGMLKVRSEIAKGGKERLIYVVSKVMNMVEDYIEAEVNMGNLVKYDQRIFPITQRRWQEIVSKTSMKALGRKISPHKLRHSFATMLINKNMPIESVQQSLGHANIANTQIYAHVSNEKVKNDFQRILETNFKDVA